MSEIICGICGTQYSDSADSCPICGTPRGYGMGGFSDDTYGMAMEDMAAPSKKKRIFDYDEVNREEEPEEEEEYEEDYYEETYEEESESNVALVVILVILIALLFLAVGFMFFRFFLPNLVGSEETAPIVTTVPMETEAPVTEPVETTEPTIPCTDLSIPGGKVELGQKGQFWLMNVQVFPQNTTDTLTFSSEDENVATVDEDGRVTAVGEGKTTIHIVCGDVKLKCSVTVDFTQDVQPATEESVPSLSVEGEETISPAETESMETTEETKAEPPADVVLKLKKTDITMPIRYGSYQMELDCDIPMEDIEWMTMDSSKAIVIDGLITATGPGTTTIKAMYNGQVAECIVRCNFG